MKTSLEFYENLGFVLKNNWMVKEKIRWCWLQLDGAALMLQEYAPGQYGQLHPAVPGQGISIYFICEDALKIYDHAMEKGLKPGEPFVGNNMWVVALEDPDGYKIFFEGPTDVQEGTRYTEWLK